VLARTLLQDASGEVPALAPLSTTQADELKKHLKDLDQDAARKGKAREYLSGFLAQRWPSPTPSPGARAVSERWIEGLLRGEPVLTR
jgi:hypothetical protein